MIVASQDSCSADDAKVLCVVRDMTDANVSTRITINLQASYTCQQLVEDIAKQFGYQPGTFCVSYEQPAGGEYNEVEITNCLDLQLKDVCANVGNNKRNSFNLMDKDGAQPVKVDSPPDYESAVSQTGSNIYGSDPVAGPANWSQSSSTSTGYGGYSYSAAVKSDTGYVGLVNQAMTCYLNSLLQTLYMTPEFRNAVYRWVFDAGQDEAVKSIPYQLQRLFIQLQTCKKRAVETTDITKSFGWDSSEAWQQHDVQELMRVMFDALEKKWKNTAQADLINKLYQGKMKDYVKCLECGYESARTDCYLDIPLTIMPFGSQTAYGSVEESLEAFVTPETLNEGNQYFCEKCNKKCDAHKGLKFTSFPYLLTLQLKRFDFDYTTMHRIKLNHKLTFPQTLNLNHFVDELKLRSPPPEGTSVDGAGDADANSGAANGDEGVDEGIEIGYSASGGSSLSSSEAAANDKNARETGVRGPYVYELYSIMIHSGSAAGGHYYAYIKSFKDGKWYSFNDQHVSTISHDDIEKTFGGHIGSRGYYSSAFASSTNAYMVVYRQIDKARNEDFTSEENFSADMAKELYRLQNREAEEQKRREIEKSTCKIKLFCFHPVHKKTLESKLEVHKDTTLTEATKVAWKQFELENSVPLDCVRLVKYDEFNDYIERSFDGQEAETMGAILDGVKATYSFELFLEVRIPDQQFISYKPGGVTVKVILVDIEREHIHPPVTVRAYLTQTVGEFKQLVHESLKLPTENMRCVLEKYYNELKLLKDPDKKLKVEGFFKSNKVFVECSGKEDMSEEFYPQSKFAKLLDRYEHTIRVTIGLPPFVGSVKGSYQDPKESPPSQATGDNQSNDSDEGICDDSESECRTQNGDSNEASDSPMSGQIKSNYLVNKSMDQNSSGSDVHAYIGDTIHKMRTGDTNVTGGGAREGDGSSQDDSESTVTSLDSCSTVTSTSTVTLSEPPCLESVLPAQNTTEGTENSPTNENTAQNSTDGAGPSTVIDSTSANEVEAYKKDGATGGAGDSWDNDEALDKEDEEYRRYFSATCSVDVDKKERSLTVYVDKRITIRALKKQLEPYVGTNSDNFKIYKVYSNNQEFECVRQSETLSGAGDDSRLNVKLGRALKPGEYRIKIYQLLLDQPDPIKFAFELIVAKAMTVAEVRRMIQQELKDQCSLNIPVDRLRVRKKTWKSPSTIFIDKQKFDHDIPLLASTELFVEELSAPERVVSQSHLSVYIRRWYPSKYEVGAFEEIILQDSCVEGLKQKLSELSGIPVENVDFARAKGTFPCECSVLEMQTDLDWNPNITELNTWPMSICDDGCVLYYRDNTEELAELSEEKRKEIQQKENIRLAKSSTSYSTKFYSRKEKALKIYTDETPVKTKYTSKSDYDCSGMVPITGHFTGHTQIDDVSQPDID